MTPPKRRSLLRLLTYARPYRWEFAGAVLTGLYKFISPVAVIWLFGESVDILHAVEAGKLEGGEAFRKILHLFGWGLALALASPLPVYLRSLWGSRAVNHVIRDLRCDLYAHLHKLSHAFFDNQRSGSLTSRVMGDVEAIQPFLGQNLIVSWMNAGVIAVILGYFFYKSWVLGLLSLLLIPVHVWILSTIGEKVKAVSRDIRDQTALLSGRTQERLANATVVKAFTREDHEIERFSDGAGGIFNLSLRSAHLNAWNQVFIHLLTNLAPLLVILLGGYLGIFSRGYFSIGLLVQFVMMQDRLYGPFSQLSESILITANALGAADRIFEIMDTAPDIADGPHALAAPRLRGELRFDAVTFTYPKGHRPVIENFSLEVPARTTLALVGPSGGGKTTLVSLLNRFYDPGAGAILIDGRNIRDFTVRSLRQQIGLVPQDPVLFAGTVEENIFYGRPEATDEEMVAAAHKAYALEFIEGLEEGFKSVIGERGIKLSAGQKQRIAIARAFLKDPPILVLDEATSALDSESERVVQQAIDALLKDRTTVIIAHRLSTVMRSDNIAVVERGTVLEQGTHAGLLDHKGLYARLCEIQFGLRDGRGQALAPAELEKPLLWPTPSVR